MQRNIAVFTILLLTFSYIAGAQRINRDLAGLFPFEENEKWGYIDRTGKVVIPAQFDFADYFVEGLAVVMTDKKVILPSMGIFSGKYGYIDKTGQFAIKPQFDEAAPFFEGLAVVCNEDSECGFINRKGKLVIKYQFEFVSVFYDGLAEVRNTGEISPLVGYINKTGKFVWKKNSLIG